MVGLQCLRWLEHTFTMRGRVSRDVAHYYVSVYTVIRHQKESNSSLDKLS